MLYVVRRIHASERAGGKKTSLKYIDFPSTLLSHQVHLGNISYQVTN